MSEMATEGSSENQDWLVVKNWRNVQKEREREKRRMRDRERRQSMSLEERERHLARRRRNYQLRRQRALSAKTGCHQEALVNTGSEAENENLELISLPELEIQSESTNPSGFEARIRVKYPYPKGLHFCQIRHLARLLNSRRRSSEARDHNQQCSGKLWRRIRLIDIKRLARALNSIPEGLSKKDNSGEGQMIWSNSLTLEQSNDGLELQGQMICSNSLMPNEGICGVEEINAYSGVFAP